MKLFVIFLHLKMTAQFGQELHAQFNRNIQKPLNLKMLNINNIIASLKQKDFEMPNAPYSNRQTV